MHLLKHSNKIINREIKINNIKCEISNTVLNFHSLRQRYKLLELYWLFT